MAAVAHRCALLLGLTGACSASHQAAYGGDVADSEAPDAPPAPDAGTSYGRPDGALPRVGCAVMCSTTPVAAGWPAVAPFEEPEPAAIIAATLGADGALRVLLAPAGHSGHATGRAWTLATLRPSAASFAVVPGATWPSTYPHAGEGLDRAGGGVDGAVLRERPEGIEAVVLFTERAPVGPSTMDVRVGRAVWSLGGERLAAEDLGSLVEFPRPTFARGTTFELPRGDVVAAIERAGIFEGSIVVTGPDGTTALGRRFAVRATDAGGDGMAPVAGHAIDEDRWRFASGGRSEGESRPAFVAWLSDGVAAVREGLPGNASDPAPLLTASAGAGLAVRFLQNPRDVDDSILALFRLGESAVGDALAVPAPRMPLPLDAAVGQLGDGSFAVWSVRAPDRLSDTLVYVAVFDQAGGCPASLPFLVGRLRGAAAAPSVHGVAVGEDLIVFGLPVGVSGRPEPAALRVRCHVPSP